MFAIGACLCIAGFITGWITQSRSSSVEMAKCRTGLEQAQRAMRNLEERNNSSHLYSATFWDEYQNLNDASLCMIRCALKVD